MHVQYSIPRLVFYTWFVKLVLASCLMAVIKQDTFEICEFNLSLVECGYFNDDCMIVSYGVSFRKHIFKSMKDPNCPVSYLLRQVIN